MKPRNSGMMFGDSSRSGCSVFSIPLGFVLFYTPLVMLWFASSPLYFGDDSYITMAYVKNLVGGHGLVFDGSERVWGFTSPAHVGVLSLLALCRIPIPWANVFVDVLCAALCSGLAILLGRKLLDSLSYGVVLGFLFVGAMPFYRFGGLECHLVFALQLGFLYALLEERRLPAALLASFCCLARPDSLLFVLPLMLADKGFWKFRHVLAFGVPGVLWLGFTFFYYGDLLPNPFYSKLRETSFTEYLTQGTWVMLTNPIPGLAFLPGLAAAVLKGGGSLSLLAHTTLRTRFTILYPLVLYPFLLIFAYALIGPQVLHNWQIQSAYYFLVMAALLGVLFAWKRWVPPGRVRKVLGPAAGAVLVAFLASSLYFHKHDLEDFSTHYWVGARQTCYRAMASWMDSNLPENAVVVFHEPGTIRYEMDRWDVRVIDWGGINNKRPMLNTGEVDNEAFFERHGVTHVLAGVERGEIAPFAGVSFRKVRSFRARGFRPHTLYVSAKAGW